MPKNIHDIDSLSGRATSVTQSPRVEAIEIGDACIQTDLQLVSDVDSNQSEVETANSYCQEEADSDYDSKCDDDKMFTLRQIPQSGEGKDNVSPVTKNHSSSRSNSSGDNNNKSSGGINCAV